MSGVRGGGARSLLHTLRAHILLRLHRQTPGERTELPLLLATPRSGHHFPKFRALQGKIACLSGARGGDRGPHSPLASSARCLVPAGGQAAAQQRLCQRRSEPARGTAAGPGRGREAAATGRGRSAAAAAVGAQAVCRASGEEWQHGAAAPLPPALQASGAAAAVARWRGAAHARPAAGRWQWRGSGACFCVAGSR